ncbi:DNA replication licensing factor mcm8 [Entomophthora muscae]|nr:DNA replication licensing factor mcm8 [Entomophthora muscae]
MELRESVTEQDAYDVVELMKLSLFDAYADDEGVLDFQRSQHGSGMTQKSDVKRFIVKLNKISDETFSNNFTYTRLYQISKDMNMVMKTDFRDFVDKLNHHGYLLKKGPNSYQLATMDF